MLLRRLVGKKMEHSLTYFHANLESQEDTLCRADFLRATTAVLFEVSKGVCGLILTTLHLY